MALAAFDRRTDSPVTFTLTNVFALLGGLLVLAFVANRLSRWTRVPDVIVLLATGILLGPVLHWVDVKSLGVVTRGFGTLALVLILFSAGLELDLRHALKQFTGGMILAMMSYGLSFVGVMLFCMHALRLERMPSMLVAATFACTSGSIVLPVLENLGMRAAAKTTLVIEASFGDGLGALGLGVLLDIAMGKGQITSGPLPRLLAHTGVQPGSGGSIASGVVAILLWKFVLGLAVAVVAGFLWRRLLPAISDMQFWQVLTFAAVLLVYAGTEKLGGSELFAVMVFGATLANLSNPKKPGEEMGFRILAPDHSHQIHSFHSELAFLVRSFFFVLLGALVEFSGLRKQLLPSLGIVGVLFVARVIAVQCSRAAWRGTSEMEREIATLLIPRGLITAVLALEAIEANPSSLLFLTSLAFAVILLSNLLVLLAAIRAKPAAAVTEEIATEPIPSV
jgi:potassium/hydrogen antiporter